MLREGRGSPRSDSRAEVKSWAKDPGSLIRAILPPVTENYPNLEVRQEEDSKSSQCSEEAH